MVFPHQQTTRQRASNKKLSADQRAALALQYMFAKRANVPSGIFFLRDPTEDTTDANLVVMMKNYDASVYADAVADTNRTGLIGKVHLFDRLMEYNLKAIQNFKKDSKDLTSAGIQNALEAHAPNCTLSYETVGLEKHIKMAYAVDDGEVPEYQQPAVCCVWWIWF